MKQFWEPRAHQLEALDFFLSNPSSGLFLDPGYGKTSISLAAIKMLLASSKAKGILLVAPLRVIYETWPGEIEKWGGFSDLSFTILHGKGKTLASLKKKKDIYFINPEGLKSLKLLLTDLIKQKHEVPFDTLWIDECSKFKNPKSKTLFKQLKLMLPLFSRVHIMTGTPSPKSYLNLWSQIYLLDRGESLGSSFYKFRDQYFHPTDYKQYNWELNPGADKQIAKKISHLVLDMSNRAHIKLPELVENYIHVELPPKAKTIYAQMERDMFAQLDDNTEVVAKASAQVTLKCHQIANGNLYEDLEEFETSKTRESVQVHTSKISALSDLVDELQGKPLLVAYHYQHDLLALKQTFGDKTPHIGGGIDVKTTSNIVSKWNAGEIPLLFGHPVSMAHGLNMQGACNDVCWFSLTWNLEDYLQFTRRVYRSGAKGTSVRVHHLVAKDTVDEAMVLRLKSRDKQQLDLRASLQAYRDGYPQ
jgi:SNF2 family DNA or RNA helicase